MRGYRDTRGLSVEALAANLHVPTAKLQALENDQLEQLPDAMFARALALAVCRHLGVDAQPVLALLPGQDISRLASKDERGLDFPLQRPSLLPQSGLRLIQSFFNPMRFAAVAVLALALLLGLWPELSSWWGSKDSQAAAVVPVPAPEVELVAAPVPPAPVTDVVSETATGKMVITPVQSAISMPVPAATAASGSGVGNVR